jgi:hypothetical protein
MKYAVFALFFLASAVKADGFYIDGGLAILQSRSAPPIVEYPFTVLELQENGFTLHNETRSYYLNYAYDITRVRNPYGTLAIGYDLSFKNLTFDLQVLHQSSIAVDDRGQDSIRLSLRWYPFN